MPFKEPSKYLTDETNSILKLWRERQGNGEVAFKFDFVLGKDKMPMEPNYPTGMFGGLAAGTRWSLAPPGDFDEEEEDEELPFKK